MLQTRAILASFLNLTALIVAALMALTLLRTLPYVPVHGVEALRDSVVVMYALFAFVVSSLVLQNPGRIAEVLRFLRWFTGIYVVLGPASFVVDNLLPVTLPEVAPGVSVLSIRGGELGVHLCGCALLALLGLRQARWYWVCALLLGAMLVASVSRGGFLAILVPVLLVLPFTRVWGKVLAAAMAGVVALGLAYAVDLRVPTRATAEGQAVDRPVGARQTVDNLVSIVFPPENQQLDDTKEFRVGWWIRIVEYTVHGPFFWTGKGFGVNLALDDGVPLGPEDSAPLRSPHNSHLTLLARAGVPGAGLWLAFLGCWLLTVLACAMTARRNGDEAWGNLLIFVAGYWVSNLVNACFDVALEGPMLGVWFWCQTGFGLALVAAYRAARSMPGPRRA